MDYTGLFGALLIKARRAVQLLNKGDEVLSIRVHSKKHETLITPDNDITFITLQSPEDMFLKPKEKQSVV